MKVSNTESNTPFHESGGNTGADAAISLQHMAEGNKSLIAEATLVAISSYPDFMTVEQVSEALQLSCNTVRSLLHQQVIPGKKLSHKWIIPREALAKAFIEI